MNVQYILPQAFFLSFVNFMENELSTKIDGAFDHFLETYKVTKFWMIKLYLHASDVINAIEHTYYANDGLHVNFWKCWLMPFCFMIKKDRFKQNFYFCLSFPLMTEKYHNRKTVRYGLETITIFGLIFPMNTNLQLLWIISNSK